MLTVNQEVDAIFSRAIEIPTPEERDAFVAQACGKDATLRRRVEERLAAHFPPRNGAEKVAHASTHGSGAPRPGHEPVGNPHVRAHVAPGAISSVESSERKYPRTVMASAIVMLGGAAVAGALCFWAIRTQKEATHAKQEANEAREKAQQAEEQSKHQREQAETERLAAANQRDQAVEEVKTSKDAAEDAKAALAFFQSRVLSAGRPVGWTGGQGKDVTLRKAVDLAEPKASEAFADRPLAEAAIRETLGATQMDLDEPAKAVADYERSLALREALQGDQHPDTVACRNQLAVAYRLADRSQEASRLFEPDNQTPTHASALEFLAKRLMAHKKTAEAEAKLRECLALRKKIQPNDWTTFETESVLGETLAQQKKFADAEPLLVSGCEGMKQREAKIPTTEKDRLTRALERLVQFYDAESQKDKAEKWRKELVKVKAPSKT